MLMLTLCLLQDTVNPFGGGNRGKEDVWDRSGRTKTYKRGLLVDVKSLKIGSEFLCRDFQTGRCSRPSGKKPDSCAAGGGREFVHLCGSAAIVTKSGELKRLCGGKHSSRDCPLK